MLCFGEIQRTKHLREVFKIPAKKDEKDVDYEEFDEAKDSTLEAGAEANASLDVTDLPGVGPAIG